MIVAMLAVAWAQGLWLGRGGIWNERVEVAVSNSTDKAWCAESVRVDVPALANARPESIRLVDSCGTQLEYAVVSPGRFILPVSAAPGEVSRYWLYAGNPHAWGLSDRWPHKPKRKIAAADVRVGELERRNLGADGENAPWPESGGWEYRVPVRVCNSGDAAIEQALVPVPSVEVFHATRNPIGCVMFNGERVPGARVGNIYTFAADVPARHVRTYYLYVKSAGAGTAPVPVQTGETMQASEIPSDQAYRERQKADGDAAKLFANLLHSKINLVRNGDFAKGEEGWILNGKKPGVTYAIARGGLFGDRCARVTAENPDAKKWQGRVQRIPVKPGRKYVYGAFVKGIDTTERSNVHLHLVDSKGVHGFGMPYGKIVGPSAQHEKTFDWTPHFGSVEIRDQDVVAIELHLTMNGGGTLLQDGAFVAESAVGAEVLTGEVEPRPLPADAFAVAQVSSAVKVFPEHHVVDSAGPFSTALARNETEDIQLAVRAGRPCSVRLEVTPPRNAQGEALAVEVGVVGYVPVDFPSSYYSARTPEEVLRMPNHGAGCDGWSGLWPDPVERGDSFEVADNAARSVRLAVTAGASARPGTYAGEIVWRQDGTIRRRDRYDVKVWNFDIPARPTFAATYDLRFGRDKSCWRVPGEKTQEGAERRVLDFMAKYKICPDDIKKNLAFTRDAAGNVTVDFAEYDQAAERFFGHYGFPNAYSPGCFYIFGWGHPPKKFMGEEPYEGKYPYKDADRKVLRPAYKKAYQDALRLYWNHLKEKGWDKRIVLYICDEPYFRQKEISDQMIALCDMIHEVDAAIPIYVSTWRHCPEWEQCLDVWGIGAYGCFPMDVMARMQKAGRRFWFTCDGQQCLDTPYCAIERLQPVYCWAYGVEKYEFWGCNWTTYDPWKYGWHSFIRQSGTPGDTFWTRYPNGDGYHIYPPRKGAKDGALSASLRLCAIRDGVEEHTYLEKLSVLAADKTAGESARKAAALCDEYRTLVPIPNAGGRYSSKILPEPEVLDRLRNRAGELLSAATAEFDLAGTWTLTQADKPSVTCPVAVPGGIYTALYEAKLIPDPYFAQNEKLTQWPSRCDWRFARSFTLPDGFAAAKAVTLRLEDVDCFATVKVNGHVAGKTSNRFQRYDFDVKPFLKAGENRIEALFESTERLSYAKTNRYDRAYHISNATVKNINLVRTVQCHGGWDWGITQMDTGFMGTVKLIASDVARIDYVYTTQEFAKDWSSAAVTVTVEAMSPAGCETTFAATLGDVAKAEKVTLKPGANKVSLTLDVKNPKLWWPVGYGAQPLYPLAVSLGDAKLAKKVGLRKVEVYNEEDAEPDPATGKKGKPMVVVINGRRIFCKGADWIPCDAFENRQTPARYRDLLESAVAANMNMLRVWGGGQFEHPAFYELCDEKGVMLWHDFMFSCATYPGDEHFLSGVRREIAHQLRNLRDHACIALWCGDNECIGAAKWFDRDEKVRAQNIQLCVARAKELEKLCATYDPTRCFWPSSPCLGPGNYGDGWRDDSSGDMHFWQVWFGDKPFSHYFSVRPRFCSEFGFQSYPTKEEALTFVTPDQLNPTAPDFAYHQKCFPNGNKFIMQMLLRNFRFPEGVDAVLYLSQIQQAMAIRTAVEAWRHLQPRCMGVIYWQLNNNWPVASWSSLDYSGKWKPLHYNMKRAYAPRTISAGPKWGDPSTIEVWAVNDRDDAFDGTVTLDLWTFEGAKNPFASRTVRLAPRAAAKVGEYKLDAFGDEAARRKLFLRMRLGGSLSSATATDAQEPAVARAPSPLQQGCGGLATSKRVPPVSNEWMFDLFMNHDLAKTDVKATFAEKDGTFLVTLSADKPAFFVWANVWQTRGEFDDNAFTLYPGEPRMLVFTPKAPGLTLDAFKKAFSVTHLRETYR